MPKYGIHHVVLKESVAKLQNSSNTHASGAGGDLASHLPMAMLGAVGPDLLFWAPDYEIVDRLYQLYKNISAVIDIYNSVIQPVRDAINAVGEPVEALVETLAPNAISLIRQLAEEAKETANLFKSTIATGLFAGVIEGANLVSDFAGLPTLAATFFELFKPPLQDGKPAADWYWFDMLHYRSTGDFGRGLVKNAQSGTAQQRAYAYGYLSHIATDLVGHPYVNQIVGGPYRLHVQRHVTVENFMDAWKFRNYYNESVSATLLNKLGLPDTLPSDVGDLIHKTISDVYLNVPHPTRLPNNGFLQRNQIDQTYEIFFLVLEIMQKMNVARPEEPFTGVAMILSDLLKDLLQPPPPPPSFSGSLCSLGDIFSFGLTENSRNCYANFFRNLGEFFSYLGRLLEWLLETLLDLFDLVLTGLLTLPITALLAALYGIQLLLYNIYQHIRSALALLGFIFPEPADLNDAHGRNLTTPFQCGLVKCSEFFGTEESPFAPQPDEFALYPRWKDLSVSHLVCPPASPELPVTMSNFADPLQETTPDEFIIKLPLDLETLTKYANVSSPVETRGLYVDCNKSIGNATDLTVWMITMASDPNAKQTDKDIAFTNWNLDADRGYGYKTWEGVLPSSQVDPVDEQLYL